MKTSLSNSRRFNGPAPKSAPLCAFGRKIALWARATPMQGLLERGVDRIFEGVRLTPLANEAEPERVALIGLGNEVTVMSDGWAVIPYGIHPNERGLQSFGRAEADRMVGYFKNGWNTIKRAFVGMPILRGHPDMAKTVRDEMAKEKDPARRASLQSLINTIERRYPDKTVYGTIADMEARDEGLAIKPVLTEDGAALVNEGGLNQFSPHWLGIDGTTPDGRAAKLPIYMVSIGLTDRPNIAGTSLVNAAPDTLSLTPMNKTLLIQLLAALGTPLANEATDDQINTAIAAAQSRAAALAARPEATALANEQSRATQLATELQAANTALANERTAHTATTKARNQLLVTQAVAAGRITEAASPTWLGRLESNFAVESVALANEQPVVKTVARTGDLGARKPANGAREQFTALVNERIAKTNESWDAAWKAVKATDAGKALVAEMDKPVATA